MADGIVASGRQSDISRGFYVYAIRTSDGTPVYIGKGKRYRWRQHLRKSHNKSLASLIERANGDIACEILYSGMSEEEAFELEALAVETIGRQCDGGTLVNMYSGGRGGATRTMSAAERAMRKEAMLRPEVRAKLRAAHIGKPGLRKGAVVSLETRERQRLSHLGKVQTAELIEKRVGRLRGKSRPVELMSMIHAKNRGKKRSMATRQRISAAKRGKKHADSHKENIKNGVHRAWSDPDLRARQAEITRVSWIKRKARALKCAR